MDIAREVLVLDPRGPDVFANLKLVLSLLREGYFSSTVEEELRDFVAAVIMRAATDFAFRREAKKEMPDVFF